MMHEIPSLSLPYDFLNKYPHLPDTLRGKGLPASDRDICSEDSEWIAKVLYFDSGKAKRGDRTLFAEYLKTSQSSFNSRLDRDLQGQHK